jgi:hypothetical protein
MRHLTLPGVALLAAALSLPACGPSPAGSLGAAPTGRPAAGPSSPAPSSPAPSSPATAPDKGGGTTTGTGDRPGGGVPDGRTITIEVWFTRDGALFPTRRTRPVTLATSRLALTELVAGPSAVESAAGVGNGIAGSTTFDVSISGAVATVDLPGSFYGGGRDPARLRQAQVVYTLTRFPTVSAVGFQRDGVPAGAPVDRSDYADLLPAIVVTSVAIGDRVTSPITVAGTANVFEATVSIRVLDAAGNPVKTAFTTATCGSGCLGDYSTTVSYRSGAEQAGTLRVYEVSAADGSAMNVVDIPVTLAASG